MPIWAWSAPAFLRRRDRTAWDHQARGPLFAHLADSRGALRAPTVPGRCALWVAARIAPSADRMWPRPLANKNARGPWALLIQRGSLPFNQQASTCSFAPRLPPAVKRAQSAKLRVAKDCCRHLKIALAEVAQGTWYDADGEPVGPALPTLSPCMAPEAARLIGNEARGNPSRPGFI